MASTSSSTECARATFASRTSLSERSEARTRASKLLWSRQILTLRRSPISSTIFIGNLSFEATEDELRTLLVEVDPRVRVRLGMDRVTGRSRGFAFAEFSDAAMAADAIRRFDSLEHRGRRLRVNDADDKPPARAPRPAETAAAVPRVPRRGVLAPRLSAAGGAGLPGVPQERRQPARPAGEEAQPALSCPRAAPRPNGGRGPSSGQACSAAPEGPIQDTSEKERSMAKKLFVGNLPFSTTDQQLPELFSQVGTCESASVITDRATGQSRGFGFVEMSSSEEAERAIEELNGHDIGGRKLTVTEARERTGGGGGGGGRGGSRPRY